MNSIVKSIFRLLFIFLLALGLFSCKKDHRLELEIKTLSASDITSNSFVSKGRLDLIYQGQDVPDNFIQSLGFIVRNSEFGYGDKYYVSNGVGNFSKEVTNLTPNRAYWIQSFIEVNDGVNRFNLTGTNEKYTTLDVPKTDRRVTFSGNGHTRGTVPDAITVESGGTISLPYQGNLEKTGYSFEGWNSNSSGTGSTYVAGSSLRVDNALTLYAEWKHVSADLVRVTFSGNGHSSGTVPDAITVEAGGTISLPNQGNLVKTGYSFKGWNSNSSGTGSTYVVGSSLRVDNARTLYAEWKQETSSNTTTITVNGHSFNMVSVPGGSFTMGCTNEQGSDCESNESPNHQVTLSAYHIGEFEVTQGLWQAVKGSNPSYFKGDNLPVGNVSWEDCQGFISELNRLTGKTFSLPTEAQWEYAARGANKSQGYKYSGSHSIGNVAWYYDNSGSKAHEVGGKQANELGLYDMSGNVSEWCSDWYGSYSSGSQTNPKGPSSGSIRVLRGGSKDISAQDCRVSSRSGSSPSAPLDHFGFRLVLVQSASDLVRVTFSGNGHSSGTVPDAISVESGGTIILPDQGNLEKTGYSFKGWNSNSSGTGSTYVVGSSLRVDNALTLYAEWKQVSADLVRVTFSGNGHSSGTVPEAITVEAGGTISLPNQGNLVKTGYSFKGWNSNSSGTGSTYVAGSSLRVDNALTLYAEWRQETSSNTTTITVNGHSFEMVSVPGGSFTMGCTGEQGSDCESNESPNHQVTLSAYHIGEFEVTQGLWQAVKGSNPSYFKGDNLPVENVSWEDCQGFISELNRLTGKTFSLPTEAQWEYAARGANKSQGYKYSGSHSIENVAWYADNSGSQTHEVGGKQANELGIYDMSGSVLEWCSDWYDSYSSSSQTNPKGPSSGSNRVGRGGGWADRAQYCRVSYRDYFDPGGRGDLVGFRLVLVQ